VVETTMRAGQIVGVAYLSNLTELKRSLLLLDRIAVIHDLDPNRDWDCRAEDPALAADLDWLQAREIVSRVDASSKLDTGIERLEKVGDEILFEMGDRPGIFGTARRTKAKMREPRVAPLKVRDLRDAINHFACRHECESLRKSLDVNAVSLYPPSRTLHRPDGKGVEPGYVQRIVIERLPEPDETTSLERILEFREDPGSKGSLLALHRWISSLSKTQASPAEVVQELDWLLHVSFR
jgi:hypothetical protein